MKLDISQTKINLKKVIELKSMPNLKVVNCQHLRTVGERRVFKKELPHLKMEDFKIADRSKIYQPENGFWDIKVDKLGEMFPDKPSPKFPLHLLDAI